MDKDITKTTLGVDKYTKKLTTSNLVKILIYGQLTNVDSLTHLIENIFKELV